MSKSKLVIFVILFVLIAAIVFFGSIYSRSNEVTSDETLVVSSSVPQAKSVVEESQLRRAEEAKENVVVASEPENITVASEDPVANLDVVTDEVAEGAEENDNTEEIESVVQSANSEAETEDTEAEGTASDSYEAGAVNKVVQPLAVTLPFSDDQNPRLPLVYTCYQNNISPPLSWSGAPEATESYVVLMEQVANEEKPLVTWLTYNIPGEGRKMGRGFRNYTNEAWVSGENDYQNTGYVGPCEPKGKIPYRITVYALDTVLDLPAAADSAAVLEAMTGRIVGKGAISFHHYYRL